MREERCLSERVGRKERGESAESQGEEAESRGWQIRLNIGETAQRIARQVDLLADILRNQI